MYINNHDWENLIGEGSGKIMSLGYVKIIFNVNERNCLKKNPM